MPCLLRASIPCLALLLTQCSTPQEDFLNTDTKKWIQSHAEDVASPADVNTAKSSEVPFAKDQADLGQGLRLVLVRGDLIGSRSLSTTSYYNLVNSQGHSLAKLPSRVDKEMDNREPNAWEIKVWASPSRGIMVVYECLRSGAGDLEWHGLIHKTDDQWLAYGVAMPRLDDNSEQLRRAAEEGVLVEPKFHYGPSVTGVSDEVIVLLPVRNVYYFVRPDLLDWNHPFPFTHG